VNPEGIIVKHYAKVDPETHTAQVLADIQAEAAAEKPASS
jgi:hypothetical protein